MLPIVPLRRVLVASALFVTVFAVSIGLVACQNAKQAENGVFTAEQILCMSAAIAADALTGDVQTVATKIESACQVAPTLTQDVIAFIDSFSAKRAAMRRKELGAAPPCADGGAAP